MSVADQPGLAAIQPEELAALLPGRERPQWEWEPPEAASFAEVFHDVVQAIRRRLAIPVVFATGYRDRETVERATAAEPFRKDRRDSPFEANLVLSSFIREIQARRRRLARWHEDGVGS